LKELRVTSNVVSHHFTHTNHRGECNKCKSSKKKSDTLNVKKKV